MRGWPCTLHPSDGVQLWKDFQVNPALLKKSILALLKTNSRAKESAVTWKPAIFIIGDGLLFLGLHWYWGTTEQRECQPRGIACLRPRSCRLCHPLPAAHSGLRHEPLRSARRCHVWLHLHVRFRERCSGQGAVRAKCTGGSCGRQPSRGEEITLLCHLTSCPFFILTFDSDNYKYGILRCL